MRAGAASPQRGNRILAFANDNGAERRQRSSPAGETDDLTSRKAGKDKDPKLSPEVGSALRNAYRYTVAEEIPSEMLDLLNKLG